MAVAIDIDYLGNLHCEAVHVPTGRRLTTDAPLDNGGKGEDFSPTDLVAAALGACMLTIMGKVADRHGIDLAGTRVNVLKEMAASPMRRLGHLTVAITIPAGRVTTEEQRQLLARAADTCPVKQSLLPDVKIDVRFEFR